jgi:hypothetical protein
LCKRKKSPSTRFPRSRGCHNRSALPIASNRYNDTVCADVLWLSIAGARPSARSLKRQRDESVPPSSDLSVGPGHSISGHCRLINPDYSRFG